jgi:hypothetical protein
MTIGNKPFSLFDDGGMHGQQVTNQKILCTIDMTLVKDSKTYQEGDIIFFIGGHDTEKYISLNEISKETYKKVTPIGVVYGKPESIRNNVFSNIVRYTLLVSGVIKLPNFWPMAYTGSTVYIKLTASGVEFTTKYYKECVRIGMMGTCNSMSYEKRSTKQKNINSKPQNKFTSKPMGRIISSGDKNNQCFIHISM